jgi:hypothetical protein
LSEEHLTDPSMSVCLSVASFIVMLQWPCSHCCNNDIVHTVTTMTYDCIVVTMTSDHIFARIALVTIVAIVIPLVSPLTSSAVM